MQQQQQQFQQQLMQQFVQQLEQMNVQPAKPVPAPAPARAPAQYSWVQMPEKFVAGDFVEFLNDCELFDCQQMNRATPYSTSGTVPVRSRSHPVEHAARRPKADGLICVRSYSRCTTRLTGASTLQTCSIRSFAPTDTNY